MNDAAAKLIASKKFQVFMGGALVAVGAGVSGAQSWSLVIAEILGLAGTFIAAQGAADFGKEKAKIEKDA